MIKAMLLFMGALTVYAILVLIPLTFCKEASDADDYIERRDEDGT